METARAAGPGSADPDWELLARVAAGEGDAYQPLVERHQERLLRLCERYGVDVNWHCKPLGAEVDWNGSGMHTNFSIRLLREVGGKAYFLALMDAFEQYMEEHIEVYGPDNHVRLTGLHETCSYKQFKYGVSDRGASIRIPWQVAIDKKGYLEDRRPNANIDPYIVARLMVETICGAMK